MATRIGEVVRAAKNGSLVPCFRLILRIRYLKLRTRVISWGYSRTRPLLMELLRPQIYGIASRWSKTPSWKLREALIPFRISTSQMTTAETISTDRS